MRQIWIAAQLALHSGDLQTANPFYFSRLAARCRKALSLYDAPARLS